MKIGIDVRCLAEGRRTGVEEYTINILQNIFELDKKNEYVLFFNSAKKARADFSWIEKYPNVRLKRFRFPNKLLNLFFWYLGWPKMDKMLGGTDIFFLPNIIFGSVSKKTKLIATIHDLSFERYPEFFSRKRKWWHVFINPKKICTRADKIIAVSESTKNDVVSLYKIRKEKIEVIHSGISKSFEVVDRNNPKLIQTKEKYALPYKFILFLGTIEPRKNIAGLVQAYNQLQKFAEKNEREDLQKFFLVIAGEKGWLSEKIFAEIEKSPFKEKIKIINFVEDEDKKFVYNLASLFVYPSFFEGFGFPPLEAMACGVPTIVSNGSSFPEIVGDAGVMIDPEKLEEIYRAMKEVLTSRELQEKMRQKGLNKAQEFDWQKTAENFINML